MKALIWPFKVIYQTARFLWALLKVLPHTKTLWRYYKSEKAMLSHFEEQRLDRILNPSKYLGKE
jgi:hypothetical protein